jgi:cytochrome c oxidase assembly protein subunit 15
MWLPLFSKLLVSATLCLIFLGGLVTSLGAGLAVPDWPTTFGHNMFLYPVSGWVGGVFFEHTHRLLASIVGLLTSVLAIWTWRVDARRWVRWLGVTAFLLVVVQGVFGGLRVTQLSVVLAIVHGCVAQTFLCVVIVLAAALSRRWDETHGAAMTNSGITALRRAGWAFVGAVYVQLVLGAVMRHLGAGLAITDFPLAYGRLIPPIGSLGVGIHFAHRAWAVLVTVNALVLFGLCLTHAREVRRLLLPVSGIIALIAFQIALGAHIIWLMRPPVTTTLHVLNGAVILGLGLLVALRASRLRTSTSPVAHPAHSHTGIPETA